MENQHPDNRIFVSPEGKEMKYNTWKLKELQTVLEGRAHYLLKKFNGDMVD